MALIIRDRVRESSNTTGPSFFTLTGPVTGFRSFASVMAVADTTFYTIANPGTNEWEVGLGTYAGANTLSRTTVYASSNGGALVNFSAGTKDVFMTYAAAQAVTQAYLASFSTGIARFTTGVGLSSTDPSATGALSWNNSSKSIGVYNIPGSNGWAVWVGGGWLSRSFSAGAGMSISNTSGTGGNPTFTNTGVRTMNGRSNTSTLYLFAKPTAWMTYNWDGDSSPWYGETEIGTWRRQQVGGGYNNTDTPTGFFRDKGGWDNANSQMQGIGFPRSAEDMRTYLRRYYWLNGGWGMREQVWWGETVFPASNDMRGLTELCLGRNWNDGYAYRDIPSTGNSFNYAIPYDGDANYAPQSGSVNLTTATVIENTVATIAVTTNTEIRLHINGRHAHFTCWTADGSVSDDFDVSDYGEVQRTYTFGASTSFYYLYWVASEGVPLRSFCRLYVNNLATTYWRWILPGDAGRVPWRVRALSSNRGNYNGDIWNSGGFVLADQQHRIWTTKSLALPNGSRPYSIMCRFLITNETIANQNVFWVANSAAPANPNGIRVIWNEGSVNRRLSITMGTTANATTTGNIIDKLQVWLVDDPDWITVCFVWNPRDTLFPGRLYVNDLMVFKTASNPFGGTTAWWNMGSTADGTANGMADGRIDYLSCMPEVWGNYVSQGAVNIDTNAFNPAWISTQDNGGQEVGVAARNIVPNGTYLRGSAFGQAANMYLDLRWDAAQTAFSLSCVLSNGSDAIEFAKTTGGFSNINGRFLVTGTGIPSTFHVWVDTTFGAKIAYMRDYAGSPVGATASGAVTVTFTRINGGGYVRQPGNAIAVVKQNNLGVTMTNELAGVHSGGVTGTCAFPNITFTVQATGVNDWYLTQNSAANDTAVRGLQNMLNTTGGKQMVLTGSGITTPSATVLPVRNTGIGWDGNGRGQHYVYLSRFLDSNPGAGSTITASFVPNPYSGYDGNFDYLGGYSSGDLDYGPERLNYSDDSYFGSSLGQAKSMELLYAYGQVSSSRLSPLGAVYDSGIFKATATTFARQMYLGNGCVGYLINYGNTGDLLRSTTLPSVTTIAYAASNGMNSDGISLTVVVNTYYRVLIYPLTTSISRNNPG